MPWLPGLAEVILLVSAGGCDCRYNPEHDPESRLLRHRATALQDMAHSFLDHELSEEFEKVCVCLGQ